MKTKILVIKEIKISYKPSMNVIDGKKLQARKKLAR
jgi:hypothetical protein